MGLASGAEKRDGWGRSGRRCSDAGLVNIGRSHTGQRVREATDESGYRIEGPDAADPAYPPYRRTRERISVKTALFFMFLGFLLAELVDPHGPAVWEFFMLGCGLAIWVGVRLREGKDRQLSGASTGQAEQDSGAHPRLSQWDLA